MRALRPHTKQYFLPNNRCGIDIEHELPMEDIVSELRRPLDERGGTRGERMVRAAKQGPGSSRRT
jgi:hypothetical protein